MPGRAADVPARTSLGLRSVLNGAFGDTLEHNRNDLALPMCLIADDGRALRIRAEAINDAVPEAGTHLLVHGLGMNDQQ